ncbi:carbohydrate ABC transporter permease [Schleiferilactobacillus harbinensis]|uniref:ABC transporter permease subunit n=1 Tax=Schleiferilactobacillus harbinensis TaxID=304207 RepID=A0A5P8M8C1_9LACO|nr:carbohydrate ABC transporter permease [Schleiferilactobacillus harbinensis]QFR24567.1 ABC transporter permease subunit [Schleiferilactobacillus harbinensis]
MKQTTAEITAESEDQSGRGAVCKKHPRFQRIHYQTKGDIAVDAVATIIGVSFALLCLIPFLFVIGTSFSSEASLTEYGIHIIPHSFSLAAYQMLFEGKQIFMSYGVTIFITVVGTLLSLTLSAMMAYPLSTGRLKLGNTINFLVYFTMLFGAGLVPSYLLISKYLHMDNTIWVLIIPGVISPWNMFLLRNFFSSIPRSLSESAEMDGASEMTILFKIILPVAKPALATIGLFYALGYWNAWFGALLYISDPNLYPLQFLIMKIMKNVEAIQEAARQGVAISTANLPDITAKMATAVVTIGPVVVFYPFVQKYFTSGLMVGSVKG